MIRNDQPCAKDPKLPNLAARDPRLASRVQGSLAEPIMTTVSRITIRPRYGEVDSMGVVYHAHYLVYFELGRTEHMRNAGSPYAGLEARGLRLAVIEASLQYLRPAKYDELLVVETQVVDVRGASVSFAYRLLGPEGIVRARGSTRLGCVDASNHPTRLPPDVREALRAGSPASDRSSEST